MFSFFFFNDTATTEIYTLSYTTLFRSPTGMLMGARVTMTDWWLWNQIPVTLGNLVGGMLFTGLLRSEEHTSELQSPCNLVCRLLLEKKKKIYKCVLSALKTSLYVPQRP